ncbi:hypothetical protein KKA33_01050 [Patescibacteria group bacterium]|nr:hypothetical protein [Patescibacteria group bacterium]
MAKKQANWITIPEETLHTPVSKMSKKQKGDSSDSVRNKIFWGVGFVIMIIAVFAVMAPAQFNELIKGSLFDAEGVGSPIASPIDLLSPDGGAGDTAESAGGAVETVEELSPEEGATEEEPAEEESDEGYVSEPVIQPKEEAVSIAIEPIAEPEPVDVGPIGEGEGGGEDEAAETEAGTEEGTSAEDTQAKLIEDLNKQLEQLQKQREEDIKTMEDLVEAAEEGLKPSASETTSVPPSVTTTSTLGQPPAVQPGFRTNTHTVTITPQAMLNRNMTGGYQIAQQSVTTPVYQPAYQVSTPSAVQTPDTGPSEVMFIAFILTFISLLGWKLIRLSLV